MMIRLPRESLIGGLLDVMAAIHCAP